MMMAPRLAIGSEKSEPTFFDADNYAKHLIGLVSKQLYEHIGGLASLSETNVVCIYWLTLPVVFSPF